MTEIELGDTIATRKLRFKRADGVVVDVLVALGKPVPDPRHAQGAWMCPFQIRGVGDLKTRAIYGVDTMQALILALHILPPDLAARARESGGCFLPADEQDLGLTQVCRLQAERDRSSRRGERPPRG
jgi:uncharacterized protein DUF6968